MIGARPAQESRDPVPALGHHVVQQGQCHRGPLKGEAAEFGIDPVEVVSEGLGPALLEGGVVALEKGPADPLEAVPDRGLAAAEPAASEARFGDRDPEELPTEPSHGRGHRSTRPVPKRAVSPGVARPTIGPRHQAAAALRRRRQE